MSFTVRDNELRFNNRRVTKSIFKQIPDHWYFAEGWDDEKEEETFHMDLFEEAEILGRVCYSYKIKVTGLHRGYCKEITAHEWIVFRWEGKVYKTAIAERALFSREQDFPPTCALIEAEQNTPQLFIGS